MTTRLLELAARRTRTVALVAVAVLAGATGGVWAATGAPSPTLIVTTVGDESSDPQDSGRPDKVEKTGKPQKPDKVEKPGKPEKPEKAAKPDRPEGAEDAGVHGQCVSAVARSDATGGKNDNHGGAVSEAAHTCPKG